MGRYALRLTLHPPPNPLRPVSMDGNDGAIPFRPTLPIHPFPPLSMDGNDGANGMDGRSHPIAPPPIAPPPIFDGGFFDGGNDGP